MLFALTNFEATLPPVVVVFDVALLAIIPALCPCFENRVAKTIPFYHPFP
ncbi:hypothetical protein RB2083_528 [Rhodobacteraceae bacterium HTCC2083]|nr:hypothetical protein RB2083_528 [Rhodobacteraceae bacterium HTCC2083]